MTLNDKLIMKFFFIIYILKFKYLQCFVKEKLFSYKIYNTQQCYFLVVETPGFQ